jgi:hypothetical protein
MKLGEVGYIPSPVKTIVFDNKSSFIVLMATPGEKRFGGATRALAGAAKGLALPGL